MEENYYEQEISFELWHGTSKENADKIVKNNKWIETTEKEKPFFGNGVYFMKDNKNLACLWSKQKNFDSRCAILCFVNVKRKFVFDLAVDRCYKLYRHFELKVSKSEKFSSAIINAIYESIEKGELSFDQIKVVIGYYSLGILNDSDKLPGECLNKAVKVEIQVVVRDQNLIKIDHIENC